MSQPAFEPPFTSVAELVPLLRRQGYAVVNAAAVAQLCGDGLATWDAFRDSWRDLPSDAYLKDGGRSRRRRHASFVVEPGDCRPVPHRAHWQPVHYNALHGGMERWFEPMDAELVSQPQWQALLCGLSGVCTALSGVSTWFVEAHQFRIDTTDGIGRPTPEGAHRDGVDFVAIVMMACAGVKGGETRVFEAQGPSGQRFTLNQPWSMLLLDDTRVIHETTPIQPDGEAGCRDTLVLTFRRQGFQDAVPGAQAAESKGAAARHG